MDVLRNSGTVRGVQSKDILTIRELARQVADIAHSEKQDLRRNLWRDVNSLKQSGVPVYLRWGGWWDEIIRPMLTCEDPFLREHEFFLRTRIIQDELADDSVIEPWITQKATYVFPAGGPWGLAASIDYSSISQGAFHIRPAFQTLEDIDRLVMPTHQIDEATTKLHVDRLTDALDGILTVNIDRAPFYRFFDGDISNQLAYLRGITELMYDIYDNPEWLKRVIAFLATGIEKTQSEAEKAGDWRLANHENQAMPYAHELKDPIANSAPVSRKELWGYMASQEFTQISPEHYDEFLLTWQRPILEKYGLTAYACCEDITNKIQYLRKIANLRRIGITAFSNCAACAEQIGADYVASWRPNPSEIICSSFDEGCVRRYLADGIRALRRNNCVYDITLKDVETAGGDLGRLKRFVQIARHEIER